MVFFPVVGISPRRLLFVLPFLIVALISLLVNSIDMRLSSLNTFIMTVFEIIILSWTRTALKISDIERIGRIIIISVLVLCLSEYVTFALPFLSGIDLGRFPSSFGFFPNVNGAAMVLFFAFIVANKVIKKRIIRIIILFSLFFIIIMTGSRASLLGASIVVFWNIVDASVKMFNYLLVKKTFLLSFLFFVLVAITTSSIWLPVINNTYQRTLTDGTSYRTKIWKDVISSTMENKKYAFFGSGPASISYDFQRQQVIRYPDGNIGLSSHNSLVEIFAWYGLLGIIPVILMLIHLLYRIQNMGVFLGILAVGLFETQLFVGNSILWSLIIYLCLYNNGLRCMGKGRPK
jgi:hypothetical protein